MCVAGRNAESGELSTGQRSWDEGEGGRMEEGGEGRETRAIKKEERERGREMQAWQWEQQQQQKWQRNSGSSSSNSNSNGGGRGDVTGRAGGLVY